jgi:hypothetical protein
MTDFLTKDQILQAEDVKTEEVEVPEWGGKVKVKTLSGRERDQLEASVISRPGERNLTNLRAKIVALSVVGPDGERLFSFEEAVELGKKSARALDRIFAVAQRLSGFTPQDVEELSKKSEPNQEESSTSG